MECHITLDWLLVWKQNDEDLILLLVDTGSHSDFTTMPFVGAK